MRCLAYIAFITCASARSSSIASVGWSSILSTMAFVPAGVLAARPAKSEQEDSREEATAGNGELEDKHANSEEATVGNDLERIQAQAHDQGETLRELSLVNVTQKAPLVGKHAKEFIAKMISLIAEISGWLGGADGNWIAFKFESMPGKEVWFCGAADTVLGAKDIATPAGGRTKCELAFGKVKIFLSVVGVVAGAAATLSGAGVAAAVLPANLGALAATTKRGVEYLEELWCGDEIKNMMAEADNIAKFNVERNKQVQANREEKKRIEESAKQDFAWLVARGYCSLHQEGSCTKEIELPAVTLQQVKLQDNINRILLGLPENHN
eukprot:TRINITY_DN111815_c0_g1_i1.p1 TRINITY_DN111815_c0_g1~~TRINITY_DN111815_c0_g1_i1.p1  ORF type:complete len:325 (+),score=62.88 TRINITY_DN111815_c0_g1_i1:82-1056(+)